MASDLVVSSLISESGIWLVVQIIKMIPTIGTAIGGMIREIQGVSQ